MLKIQTKKGAELTSIQHNGKEMLFQGAQVLTVRQYFGKDRHQYYFQ